jgi:hypothetical protein
VIRRIRLVGITVAAAFALVAIPAASALASPEWYVKGNKVMESIPTTSSGELQTEAIYSPGKEEWTCTASGAGTVGPEGKGTVTEQKLTNCKYSEEKVATCEAGRKATITAANLPWATRLEYRGGSVPVEIVEPGKSGKAPGWKWECILLSPIKSVVECTKTLEVHLYNEPEYLDEGFGGRFLGASLSCRGWVVNGEKREEVKGTGEGGVGGYLLVKAAAGLISAH